jgi:hypothetical protein
MRYHRWFWLLVMTLLARGASAAVSVVPSDGCPASAAIDVSLDRLGVLALLAQAGTAEVRVEEPLLHVSFRDRRGEPLGTRVVAATADCAERAALAAAVIAAFAGDWAQAETARPPVAPAGPATDRSEAAVAAAVAAPSARPARPWQAELGVMAFGVYDGDVVGAGLGGRGDLGRGAWLGTALVEISSEREQVLGQGRGGYRFVRAGLGLGLRHRWSRVAWDATLLPMVARLSLQGKDLAETESATAWEVVVAGQTRLFWELGRLRPFLFLGASYDMPTQRMTLRDGSARVGLSPINYEGGLGISVRILP